MTNTYHQAEDRPVSEPFSSDVQYCVKGDELWTSAGDGVVNVFVRTPK